RRCRLTSLARDVVRNALPLAQRLESGGLDGGDVDEHVPGTILRLDKSEPLRHVEELHLSDRHVALLCYVSRSGGAMRDRRSDSVHGRKTGAVQPSARGDSESERGQDKPAAQGLG